MSELPKSWLKVPIREVSEVNPRKSIALTGDALVSFVPMAAVDEFSGTIARPIDRPYQQISKGFTHIREGDVIFAKITPSMENGKSAVARQLTNGTAMGSTEFHVLRSNGAVQPEYLWRFVRQKSFREAAQSVMSGAVGQQRVPAAWLENYTVPLPPLREQSRIVDKIAELIAHTTRARKELNRIPDLTNRYKSAVLASAFSGRLTKDWRQDDSERLDNDTELPSSWSIKPLEDISEIQGGIQVGKKRIHSGNLIETPYLRVANVQRGWLSLDEVKTIRVTAAELDRLRLRDRDILMNEGGDRDKLGRGWVWHDQIPGCIHQNHVFRIRLIEPDFPPEFVSHYANENGQRYFFEQGIQTTNLASISKSKVSALPVPVPPKDEAIEIVRRIDLAFAWFDRLSADHAAAVRLLPKLDAAILAKAFNGKLVPQDPKDEAASVLLKRVYSENETAASLDSRSNSAATTSINIAPRRTGLPKKGTSMRKIRKSCKDSDVMGQPYLATIVREMGGKVPPNDLYLASSLDVVDFYQQLSAEHDRGWLREDNMMVSAA